MHPNRKLFTGTSHPQLAREVANILGMELGKMDVHLFPDGETYVELLEPVENCEVFVIQSLFPRTNDYLMELLIILDALKRAGAAFISIVVPYYAYARQDRLNKPGEPITAKLVADLLSAAGAHRIITVDLHSEQIEGFVDFPVEHLSSRPCLIGCLKSLGLENGVVVAPDKGGIKIAGAYAKELEWPMALVDKERVSPTQVEVRLFVGDVKDKSVLIVDDMCSSGATLVSAAKACAKLGAKRILAAVGHGLFVADALQRIEESPIQMIIATNTVPVAKKAEGHPKVRIVSIASLLAKFIGG